MLISARQFVLPDLLVGCPLKDATNPYYKEAMAESHAWIGSYDIFNDRKRAFFFQVQSELLCSHAYPYAAFEQFRTTCDFVHLLYVVDELSDEQSGDDACATAQVFVNAMQDSTWDNVSILAKLTKEFRARLLRHAGPNNMKRFMNLCQLYTEAVGKEAELRESGQVLQINEFIHLRRQNSAVPLCFALVEYALGIDLSEEVYEDQTFITAYWAAVDYICWANDVYSYDMEQSRGLAGNNIVVVIMKEKHISLQEASDFVGDHCNSLLDKYLTAKNTISPELGSDAALFIDSLGHWMIGNIIWSFESSRYFGSRHLQVKETKIVDLRPRQFHEGCTSPEEED